MSDEKASDQIVETTMKYFFYDLKTRSQTQHRDLVSDFKAFIKCYPKLKETYEPNLKQIIKTPIKFFIRRNPNYFKVSEKRKLDDEFSLANLDFLYFRDTSFSSKLKTKYGVSYSRPTSKRTQQLDLSYLLDITAYIRDYLYTEMIQIAKDNNLEIPLMLPAVEPQERGGVGIDTKTNFF